MRRRFEGDGVRDKFVDLSRRDWMRASAQMTCGVAAIAALGGSACVLSACAQHDDSTPTTVEKPERVIAYVSVDDALARGMLAACTAATGIAIDPVFDSEVSKTTGLENRIRAERDRPRADPDARGKEVRALASSTDGRGGRFSVIAGFGGHGALGGGSTGDLQLG